MSGIYSGPLDRHKIMFEYKTAKKNILLRNMKLKNMLSFKKVRIKKIPI